MSCDDSIVLIHAHLSDEERIKVCLEFVRQIKSFGYDVIVSSHTPASKEFQDEVDYFVYDKDNTVLSDVSFLGWMTWYAPNFDVTSKEFCSYNTVLAVFRLMHIGTAYAKLLGKDKIHIFDYDGFLNKPDEMKLNEAKIDNGLEGVFYYWQNEKTVDDGRGTQTTITTKLQTTTRFISAKVDFLLDKFEKLKNLEDQKEVLNKFSFLVGEEFFAYAFNLTAYNGDQKVTNVELIPFVDNLERIDMIQDRIHTHQDFPWVALTLDECVKNCVASPIPNFLFLMNPHKPTNFDIFVDDKFFFNFNAGQSHYHMLHIYERPKIDIYCDKSHFRTYDLRNSDEITRLKICNSLYFKN